MDALCTRRFYTWVLKLWSYSGNLGFPLVLGSHIGLLLTVFNLYKLLADFVWLLYDFLCLLRSLEQSPLLGWSILHPQLLAFTSLNAIFLAIRFWCYSSATLNLPSNCECRKWASLRGAGMLDEWFQRISLLILITSLFCCRLLFLFGIVLSAPWGIPIYQSGCSSWVTLRHHRL